MLILENIALALAALKANKLRSILTMLGIVIGIAAVITIMMVGDGLNRSVMSSMEGMGANNIQLGVQEKNSGTGEKGKKTEKDYLNEQMLEGMEERFQGQITGIALEKTVGDGQVKDGRKYANISIEGLNEAAFRDKKIQMLSGRGFTAEDYKDARKVALVSDKFVEKLFAGDTKGVLGKTVDTVLDNKYYTYTIVGVYKYVQSDYEFSAASAEEIRTKCYLPLMSALQQTRSKGQYESISVAAGKGVDPEALSKELKNYLNGVWFKDNRNYEIYSFNMESMINETKKMIVTLQTAMAGIAAISLLVGGIGVMNIMVVSITERTREIGTRKALGAEDSLILFQFMVEAVVICFIGGAIGVLLGLGIGMGATKLMGYAGHISAMNILVCVLFSVAFGMFFGYYPAKRAAKMNPIDALRHE